MAAEPEHDVLVFDNGSEIFKGGFAGDDEPTCVLPSVALKDGTAGFDVYEHKDDEWIAPIKAGVVQDWDAMEAVWNHVFKDELHIDPEGRFLYVTEPHRNPKVKREAHAELVFEKFKAAGTYLQMTGMLTLYSSGRTEGIVLDVGADQCTTCPVSSGFPIPHAIKTLNVGSNDCTDFMQKQLNQNQAYPTGKRNDRMQVRNMKEQFGYVCDDMDEELEKFDSMKGELAKYTMPDGKEITIGPERFLCSEVLFTPEFVGNEANGVVDLIFGSIQACPIDIRTPMYQNIVLSGGGTLFPNFEKRLNSNLVQLCPQNVSLKVSAPEERSQSVWIGGSIVASLGNFAEQWVTKAEYEEHGKGIIDKKCPKYEE